MVEYFADTYALAAHYKDSRRYRPYFDDVDLAISSFNLLEFGAFLLKHGAAKDRNGLADLLEPLWTLLVEPGPEVATEAAVFRRDMQKAGKDCSYVDAWGYATARSIEVPFLTGDEHFRGVPYVEFVKE